MSVCFSSGESPFKAIWRQTLAKQAVPQISKSEGSLDFGQILGKPPSSVKFYGISVNQAPESLKNRADSEP